MFMEFSSEVMQLWVTTKPYILIPCLQLFQNGGCSDFWCGCNTCIGQCGTLKFCKLVDIQMKNSFKCGCRLKVKIYVLFYENNSWTIAFRQKNFVKYMDIRTTFIVITVFREALKHGYGAKYWVYAGINAEQFCIEFFNFVQHHILVN
jgi:hypothetical protein